ncbi:Transcription factor Ouib [Gryllus bimaculatus]|nr:Transcription factor Ouib [Gryllus bimaculatus]
MAYDTRDKSDFILIAAMGKPKKKMSSLTKINYKRRSKRPKKVNSVDIAAADNIQNEDCETKNLKKKRKLGHNAIHTDILYENDSINGNMCNEEILENNILLPDNSSLDSTCEFFDAISNGDNIEGKTEDEEVGYGLVLENLKSQLCRVCGRIRTSLLPIFGTHFETEDSISEKIQMHLPLEAWHDLHVSCVAADTVLRRTFMEADVNNTSKGERDNLENRWFDGGVKEVLEEMEMLFENKKKLNLKQNLGSILDHPQKNSFITAAKGENEVQRLLENKEENANDATDPSQMKWGDSYENFENFNNKQDKMHCEYQQAMCEFCGICVKQKNLRNHVLKVHTETMLCETCGKFFSWYSFKTHCGECVLDPIRYCELCSRVFLTEKGYEIHMQEHEQGINQFLRVKIKASIQDELSVVYYCPVCGTSYQDKISVIVHLNAKKIMTCRPCNKVFSNERAFLAHIHMPNQAFWHCRYCFQIFKRKYSWQIHERAHSHQNRSYCCEMCRKQCPSIESLLQHILCHGSNNYFCAQCNMKFNRQSSLKAHVLQHEGFIFKCKSCTQQFQSSRSLRLHKAKEHGKGILLQKQKVG